MRSPFWTNRRCWQRWPPAVESAPHGLACLAVFLVLTDACHHIHALFHAVSDLFPKKSIGLAENVTALGVTNESPVDPHVLEHRWAHLASVCPFLDLPAVLGRNIEVGRRCRLHCLQVN